MIAELFKENRFNKGFHQGLQIAAAGLAGDYPYTPPTALLNFAGY